MDLPSEILHIIFSFCSATDLLESLQYVCQSWHEAVLSPWVWRKKILNVSGHKTSKGLKSLLIQLPFLKNVLMQGVNMEALTLLSENCPLLEYLKLEGCTQLQFLDIYNPISQFNCLMYIDVSFKQLFCLERIMFKNCDIRFPPLLSTVIFRKAVTDGSFLLSLLQTCKFLQQVVISHVNVLESFLESSLVSIGFIDKSVQKPSMRTFYLSLLEVPNTEKNILLLEKVGEFRNLKYLALKHNQFCDTDMLQIIFKKPHPELVLLDLGYSVNVTTNTFDSVIKLCPNLVYLSFERCSVTDSTVLVIFSLSRLQYLNLHGTQISSQYFPAIPERLPYLRDLNLCACRRIDKDVLKVLVCAMPNLIIVLPRIGVLKGALAVRSHSFLELRNNLM